MARRIKGDVAFRVIAPAPPSPASGFGSRPPGRAGHPLSSAPPKSPQKKTFVPPEAAEQKTISPSGHKRPPQKQKQNSRPSLALPQRSGSPRYLEPSATGHPPPPRKWHRCRP